MEKITRREKVRNRTKKYQTNKQTNEPTIKRTTNNVEKRERGGRGVAKWRSARDTHTRTHTGSRLFRSQII